MVKIVVGPILGEVTTNKAVMLLEVQGEEDVIPVCAKLYKEQEKGTPAQEIDRNIPARRPAVFEFTGLEPETEYTSKFL